MYSLNELTSSLVPKNNATIEVPSSDKSVKQEVAQGPLKQDKVSRYMTLTGMHDRESPYPVVDRGTTTYQPDMPSNV